MGSPTYFSICISIMFLLDNKVENVSTISFVLFDQINKHIFKDHLREAFKRKNRKYIGLLPILGGGGGEPKNDLYAQKHVKSE